MIILQTAPSRLDGAVRLFMPQRNAGSIRITLVLHGIFLARSPAAEYKL